MNAVDSNTFAPNIRPDCTDELTAALGQRIMVIDGAMGTAIQRDRPDEAGYRGERFIGVADRSSGQQRPAHPDAAADHRGDPPRVPRGGCRHPGDQHVQRERGLALRLRHARAGLRAELRRSCPGAQGRATSSAPRRSPATSPAPSGRRRGPRRSRRTSTTPEPATSPTTSWSPPTSKLPTAWSTVVPTSSSSRRSSTR